MSTITGSLTYRQRIALRPRSVAEITLTPQSSEERSVEGEARTCVLDLGDQQVPIDFDVDLSTDLTGDPRHFELTAAIDDADGTRRWTTPLPIVIEAGDEPVDVGLVVLVPAP